MEGRDFPGPNPDPKPFGKRALSLAEARIDSPPPRSPHFRRVRAAVCSYVDAEMGCIGDVMAAKCPSRHTVGRMVIGAYGDSTVRSGFPGGARRCSRGGMPCSRQLRLVGL